MKKPSSRFWKHASNWVKVFIAVEIPVFFFFGKTWFGVQPNMSDLVYMGMFQYGIFGFIDLGLFVQNFTGRKSDANPEQQRSGTP